MHTSPELSPVLQKKQDPKPEVITLMRLLAEQGAVWIDQFAELSKMNISDVVLLIKEAAQLRWVGVDRTDSFEYPFVWLRAPGVRLFGMGPSGGRPNIYKLAFLQAANSARIFYLKNFPELQWRAHDLLLFDYRASHGIIPAAILERVDDDGIIRRCAVELDCAMQYLPAHEALSQVCSVLDEQVSRYDTVDLFTSGRFLPVSDALEKKYPTLTTRTLSSFWLPTSMSPEEVWTDLKDFKVGEKKVQRPSTESNSRLLIKANKPMDVFKMDLTDMPLEIPQIIATEGFEQYPHIVGLWKQNGGGPNQIYCVETEVAVYRVIYSSGVAHAEKVKDDSLFIKRTDKAKKIFTEHARGRQPVRVHEGTKVFKMDLTDMPPEIPQVIATDGFEQYPRVIGLWLQRKAGPQIYCVETEVAVYRVIRSNYGWRADKVIDDSLFIKYANKEFRAKAKKVFTEHPKGRKPIKVREGTEVFEIDLTDMPLEIPQIIAIEGFEQHPHVVGLWKHSGGPNQIYCVETEAAVYRVVQSRRYGWRADEVIAVDRLFIKVKHERKRLSPSKSRRVKDRVLAYKFDPAVLPPEAAEAIANCLGITYLPRFTAAWKKFKGGGNVMIFCVETSLGFFRLSRSQYGWRADLVDPDAEFLRKDEPPPHSPTSFRYLIVVYPYPLAEIPPEIPQAIAEIRDPQKPSHISAIWRNEGSNPEVFCVETDVGIYRVDHSLEYGWRVFCVSDNVFLKEAPRQTSPPITDPNQMKVSDELWSKIASLFSVSKGNPTYSGVEHSDRAVLDAVLYRIYLELKSWKHLPVDRGFPGYSVVRHHLRRWQEEGIWEPVRKILEEELPEGKVLKWTLADPGRYCSPLNRVVQL